MTKKYSCRIIYILLLSVLIYHADVRAQCQNPGLVFNEAVGSVSSTTTIATHETNNGFDNDAFTFSGTGDIRNTNVSSGYGSGNPAASGNANIFLTNTAGRNCIISGINTSATGGNLRLAFGIYKSTNTGTGSDGSDFEVSVSNDGVTYSTLIIDPLPAGTNTIGWYYRIAKGNIPVTANLRIQFRQKGTATQYRIDDINLSYGNTPVILNSGSLTFCNGDSVTLSVSASSSYLWNNGATTQSIVVKNAGNYSINVNCIPSTSVPVIVNPCARVAEIKLYIEGLYISGGNLSPVIDPVNSPLISDSLTLTLHDSASASALFTVSSALNTTGVSLFYIPYSYSSSYYLELKHRNSLSVFSKNTVSLNKDTVIYNFSGQDTGTVVLLPELNTLSPASTTEGSDAFLLTASGNNFTGNSVIKFNGLTLSTTYISSTTLNATVPSTAIDTAAVVPVAVVTPGAGNSSSLNFTITPQTRPVPVLSSVSPSSVNSGAAAFTLTVNGTDFFSSSVIQWNGNPLTTAYVSSTQLTATVNSSLISSSGTASITVFTPAPGGGTSSALTFTIIQSNPVPAISNLSPSSVVVGAASFLLTVNGSGFYNGSVIRWNGAALTTNYISASQLTTTIAASLVDTAGSIIITVFNAAPGGGTSGNTSFTITSPVKKFLFDATKAETAGNADWVIDQDASPQRFPTPSQSTITASTSETYWNGAISAFGIDIVKAGHNVETLPSGTAISYGNANNLQDLSNYNVFVIDEPNIVFSSSEKTAILNFVQNGGGLFLISDHTISDRNNDGWDSPEIINDLMSNNSVQVNPFGFTVDLTDLSFLSSNVRINSSSNVILNGTFGTVTQVDFHNGATLTLNPANNSSVTGLVWRSSVTQNNSNVICASAVFGQGRVFIISDSSPMDDGTGAAGNTLFDGYSTYSHKKLFMNAALWLSKISN